MDSGKDQWRRGRYRERVGQDLDGDFLLGLASSDDRVVAGG